MQEEQDIAGRRAGSRVHLRGAADGRDHVPHAVELRGIGVRRVIVEWQGDYDLVHPVESRECALDALPRHLRWKTDFLNAVVDRAVDDELVFIHEGLARLTLEGRDAANRAVV